MLIDSSHPEPRAAIFHSSNLQIWPVLQLTNRDMCTGLLIGPNNERIYITSLYLPSKGGDGKDVPLRDIITQDIKTLVAQVQLEKAQLIVMADVNAWSALWKSDRTTGQSCKRGTVVANFFCDNHLRVMNHGNRYTYVRYNSQSMIDVTVATGDISKQIEHWKVRDALAYSDHCSIEFVLRLKGLKPTYK